MDGAVQVQLGLKKFFIYFFISAILGLFLNSLIQKSISRLWKDRQSEMMEKNISGSQPVIVFSRSGWPVIGASIPHATHRTSFKCYGLVTEVSDVFVPLPISQLIAGRLRFGTIDVGQMKMEIQEDPACPEQNVVDDVNSRSSVVDREELVGPEAAPSWFTFLKKWPLLKQKVIGEIPFPSIRVRDIQLAGSTLGGKSVVARGEAELLLQEDLKIDFNFKPIVLKKREQTLSTNLTAHLVADSEQIKIQADWAYDEGHVVVDLSYKQVSGVADILLKTTDLPVSVVNRWFDTSWAFQFLWFNCGMHLSSTEAAWSEANWDISDCNVSGHHGKITVLSQQLHSIKRPQGLSFQIHDFDLDKVIKGKENVPLDGVFNKFGLIEGQAKIDGNDFSSQLNLKNAQVIFSRKNQRRLQLIDQIKLDLGYHGSVYSVLIHDAQLAGGQFEGFLAFDYNKHLKQSRSKVSIEKLEFSPEVQKLMWSGKFSPFAITGDIALDKDFKMELAKLKLSFSKYEAQGLVASTGLILLDWQKEGGGVSTSLAQLKVSRGSSVPWIFAPFLDESVNRDVLVISRAYSQGHFEKSHFILDKLVASAANQKLTIRGDFTQLNSQGEWDWGADAKSYKWKWLYADQRFTLIPLTAEMREWLKLNDSFLEEYPFIRMENSDI